MIFDGKQCQSFSSEKNFRSQNKEKENKKKDDG